MWSWQGLTDDEKIMYVFGAFLVCIFVMFVGDSIEIPQEVVDRIRLKKVTE